MKAKKPDIESATNELRSLMREAEVLLAEKGGEADEKASHLTDRLNELISVGRDRAEKVTQKAREATLKAKESAQEQLTQCDDYVRTHPYHAVGIAAGIGALIGVLASSSRKAA
ncbi:DUF883 family protein [Actomonas aquatica]|uniref:DUF883 domain-containing protein n=1 Tax=Actomonas aquatica TaxID=2866162 RepID=A0ABZ1CFA7_9BACT|nr:hypothetical protein [Opitutus sp. WL0086]WRQ89977.1 hypothetical protein K1X11_011210 [Opitutus sp. WL0086]